MYLSNKYTTWYYRIISNAQSRTIDGYVERHHIVPKSLGGDNSKENLVKLTAREHFIAHRLLVKMVSGSAKNKMVHALWRMTVAGRPDQKRYYPPSKLYDRIRRQYSTINSIRHKGKIMPRDAASKRLNTMLERHGVRGMTRVTEEQRKARSLRQTNNRATEETKNKMSISHQGSKNYNAKLTDVQAAEIKHSILPSLELSIRYNISRSLVYKIKNGSAWSHIT